MFPAFRARLLEFIVGIDVPTYVFCSIRRKELSFRLLMKICLLGGYGLIDKLIYPKALYAYGCSLGLI